MYPYGTRRSVTPIAGNCPEGACQTGSGSFGSGNKSHSGTVGECRPLRFEWRSCSFSCWFWPYMWHAVAVVSSIFDLMRLALLAFPLLLFDVWIDIFEATCRRRLLLHNRFRLALNRNLVHIGINNSDFDFLGSELRKFWHRCPTCQSRYGTYSCTAWGPSQLYWGLERCWRFARLLQFGILARII